MMANSDIKLVYGSRRKIRHILDDLIERHVNVLDVRYRRHGIHYIATIHTGR